MATRIPCCQGGGLCRKKAFVASPKNAKNGLPTPDREAKTAGAAPPRRVAVGKKQRVHKKRHVEAALELAYIRGFPCLVFSRAGRWAGPDRAFVFANTVNLGDACVDRRKFLLSAALSSAAGIVGSPGAAGAHKRRQPQPQTQAQPRTQGKRSTQPMVRTVLGPVAPEKLGVTLMHEHAPTVDWSELFETPAAPIGPLRKEMLLAAGSQLRAFHDCLPADSGPGAIVECTPIRAGRFPDVLVELAKSTKVHVIGCTGFWCEAMAPQHPWAVRLGVQKGGVRAMADLYIREIRTGMEDPSGEWGEKFTNVPAGIVKVATSTFLRPSERRCHEAAAIASTETGCPITSHTTDGGGLEQARLLIERGAKPEKIIVGHQGHLDDRTNEEAHEAHLAMADLGCYVQFDRVAHSRYAIDKIVRQVKVLVDRGHAERVLLGHDLVPFVYSRFSEQEKPVEGWKANEVDLTTIPVGLAGALQAAGLSAGQVRTLLVENPRRVLAF